MKLPIVYSRAWMRFSTEWIFATLWAATCLAQVPSPAPGADANVANGPMSIPRIRFATPIYDFGPVVSGAVVRHDFVFTNMGQAVLEISGVHASCGCTTAGEWTRRVAPGQTGIIPIQLNTAGFQGMVLKHVTITCNDPEQPTVTLQVRANIWTPIELNPRYAVLHANAERLDQARAIVTVMNREQTPLRLETPQSNSPHIRAEVVERVAGREYELVILPTELAPLGNVQGVITVPTSSTNVPQLNVTVLMLMQPVVSVAPPLIQLAPGPLPAPQTVAVAVMNSGTNRLHLSDVTVNDTNVVVEVQETNPGQYFNILLHFPAGFELAPGQFLTLSGHTSHPNHPQFRVPITQMRGAPPLSIPPRAVSAPSPPAVSTPPPPSAPTEAGATTSAGAAVRRPARPPTEMPPWPGQ